MESAAVVAWATSHPDPEHNSWTALRRSEVASAITNLEAFDGADAGANQGHVGGVEVRIIRKLRKHAVGEVAEAADSLWLKWEADSEGASPAKRKAAGAAASGGGGSAAKRMKASESSATAAAAAAPTATSTPSRAAAAAAGVVRRCTVCHESFTKDNFFKKPWAAAARGGALGRCKLCHNAAPQAAAAARKSSARAWEAKLEREKTIHPGDTLNPGELAWFDLERSIPGTSLATRVRLSREPLLPRLSTLPGLSASAAPASVVAAAGSTDAVTFDPSGVYAAIIYCEALENLDGGMYHHEAMFEMTRLLKSQMPVVRIEKLNAPLDVVSGPGHRKLAADAGSFAFSMSPSRAFGGSSPVHKLQGGPFTSLPPDATRDTTGSREGRAGSDCIAFSSLSLEHNLRVDTRKTQESARREGESTADFSARREKEEEEYDTRRENDYDTLRHDAGKFAATALKADCTTRFGGIKSYDGDDAFTYHGLREWSAVLNSHMRDAVSYAFDPKKKSLLKRRMNNVPPASVPTAEEIASADASARTFFERAVDDPGVDNAGIYCTCAKKDTENSSFYEDGGHFLYAQEDCACTRTLPEFVALHDEHYKKRIVALLLCLRRLCGASNGEATALVWRRMLGAHGQVPDNVGRHFTANLLIHLSLGPSFGKTYWAPRLCSRGAHQDTNAFVGERADMVHQFRRVRAEMDAMKRLGAEDGDLFLNMREEAEIDAHELTWKYTFVLRKLDDDAHTERAEDALIDAASRLELLEALEARGKAARGALRSLQSGPIGPLRSLLKDLVAKEQQQPPLVVDDYTDAPGGRWEWGKTAECYLNGESETVAFGRRHPFADEYPPREERVRCAPPGRAGDFRRIKGAGADESR